MREQEKRIVMEERARMKAKLAQGIEKVIDPVVRVKFQNIEDPPVPGRPSPPFEFTYQTAKGIILSFKVSRNEENPDTALRHGETYELPLSVVNHLNSVQTPVYGQRHISDPVTGSFKIVNYIATYRNRFACTPVDMSAYQVIDKDDAAPERAPEKVAKKRSEQEKTNRELAGLSAA